MADPFTWAAMGIAGAAISGAGTAMGYEAQAANAAYRAQVAENNAQVARWNSAMETQKGEIDTGNSEMKTRAMVGRTLAGQGASGVNVNSGSSVQVRAAVSELGMLDALTVRSNAAKKAWADDVQAESFEAVAGLDRDSSDQASMIAPIAGAGSFLSGASSSMAGYAKYLS